MKILFYFLFIVFSTAGADLSLPRRWLKAKPTKGAQVIPNIIFKNPYNIPPVYPNTYRTNLIWECDWITNWNYDNNNYDGFLPARIYRYSQVCIGHTVLISSNYTGGWITLTNLSNNVFSLDISAYITNQNVFFKLQSVLTKPHVDCCIYPPLGTIKIQL